MMQSYLDYRTKHSNTLHSYTVAEMKAHILEGTVRVFRHKFTLEDDIGSHACSLEASRRVTNDIPLGSPLFLPVHTVNCVQTLKEPTSVFQGPFEYIKFPSARCAFSDRNLHPRMPLDPAHVRLKLLHACGQ